MKTRVSTYNLSRDAEQLRLVDDWIGDEYEVRYGGINTTIRLI